MAASFTQKVRRSPPSGVGGNRRPYHFLCYHCANLRINNLDLINCAYHSIRVIPRSKFCYFDVTHHNRVNGTTTGFTSSRPEFVTISNCIINQDDACAAGSFTKTSPSATATSPQLVGLPLQRRYRRPFNVSTASSIRSSAAPSNSPAPQVPSSRICPSPTSSSTKSPARFPSASVHAKAGPPPVLLTRRR